jgi:magnesium transporter
MRKLKYKKERKLHPYNLEYTGIHKNTNSEIQLFVYDNVNVSEFKDFKVAELEKHINLRKINWLNIHGLNNIELLRSVSLYFKIDNFMLSDILNTSQRTKIEEQNDILFFNIKSLLPSEHSDTISAEQISFFIKEGVLISFQEKRSDFFTHIRERIRTNSGIIRSQKTDYLLYILLDAVMENFYITIENEEGKIEDLINQTKSNVSPVVLERIEIHRDNLNFLRRSIIPLRDSLYNIKSMKDDNVFNLIEPQNFSFFSRLHQKCLELLDQVDSDMGSLESASNFFFSAQSHKMNEIMKTLTIISSIFIPLTFIVGVYGMNFKYMPELEYKNGYHTIIGVMILSGLLMLYYFKKRRWF